MRFLAGRATGSRHGVLALILAVITAPLSTAIAAPAQAHEPFAAKAWGYNGKGELGTGTTEGPETCSGASLSEAHEACSTTPVAVSGLSGVTAVAGGGGLGGTGQSLALLENGTVMAWGANDEGQLGNGTTEKSDVPVAVKELSKVTAIAASGTHGLALLENGTVMAWGANFVGQLGNGTTKASDVPVPVKELSGVVAIAAGGEHSVAVLSNGKVMAWGRDSSGQLGNGSKENTDVPVPVCAMGPQSPCPTGPYLEGVKAVSASNAHSLALLSSGKVMAWGDNREGELGNATEASSDVPAAVCAVGEKAPCAMQLSGVAAISAGGRGANGGSPFSVALLSNETVVAWGDNTAGELGDGTSTGPETCGEVPFACSKAPVAVSELGSGVRAIAAHGDHTLALLANGTVKAWGSNEYGMLGDGTSTGPEACAASFGSCSTKPVEVSGLVDAKGIGDGDVFSLAFGPPPPSVTALSPKEGAEAGGTSVSITGAEFEETTSVKFGSADAKSFTVNSQGSVTAVAPAGTGAVDVVVTTPAGSSATSLADQFSYVRPPAVTGVEPNHGSAAGGTSVTISGSNFSGASAVKFGSTNAASFTVNSASSVTALAPPGTGAVDVTVTTAGGTSATNPADRFTYGPTVSKVEPNHGSPSGGTTVTVTGTGFTGATAVKFGASNATKFTVNSATSITAVSPKAKGTVDVTVTTATGTSPTSSADQFTYMKK